MVNNNFFGQIRVWIFILALVPMMANAGTAYNAGTMSVTITIQSSCNVAATAMNFGNYNLAQLDGTSTISVTCTNGTAWSAALSKGSGSFTTRKMISGANSLNYNLYTSAAKTQVWGDGSSGTSVVTGTGTGATQTQTVYGAVPASQPSPISSYSDTITVTVSFS